MMTTTLTPTQHDLLTAPVRETLASLHRAFEPRLLELLGGRAERADRIRMGEDLSFPPETEALRVDDTWRVRPAPADLARRSVELAGPATTAPQARVARSCGADTWVADLEDALVSTWERLVAAHRAIGDYVRHAGPDLPTLIVRPRGLHLQEDHVRGRRRGRRRVAGRHRPVRRTPGQGSARAGQRALPLPAQAGAPR